MVSVLHAEIVCSRVSQQGGATYDLMASRDPAHVTVTSLAAAYGGDVGKSSMECGDAERKSVVTSSVITSSQLQTAATDFSRNQHANNTCVYNNNNNNNKELIINN